MSKSSPSINKKVQDTPPFKSEVCLDWFDIQLASHYQKQEMGLTKSAQILNFKLVLGFFGFILAV
jgi:hypothetical protein